MAIMLTEFGIICQTIIFFYICFVVLETLSLESLGLLFINMDSYTSLHFAQGTQVSTLTFREHTLTPSSTLQVKPHQFKAQKP